MQIHVRLHGALRDKLPAEMKGRAVLDFEEGTTVTAVLAHLSLHGRIQVALNQKTTENKDTILQDGDRLEIFRPAAGGER
jgi:sulfur carrier protein ThiS